MFYKKYDYSCVNLFLELSGNSGAPLSAVSRLITFMLDLWSTSRLPIRSVVVLLAVFCNFPVGTGKLGEGGGGFARFSHRSSYSESRAGPHVIGSQLEAGTSGKCLFLFIASPLCLFDL